MGDPSAVCTSGLGGTSSSTSGCSLSPPAAETALLKDWEYLLNFRPPGAEKDIIKQRFPDNPDPGYHPIENGVGPCNLDFYAVQINQFPKLLTGDVLDAPRLVDYVRGHLQDFLDQEIAEFDGVTPDDDITLGSNAPLGAVMRFRMDAGAAVGRLVGAKIPAGVICSESVTEEQTGCPRHSYDLKHWIFATMPLKKDGPWVTSGAHPVAGNRQFGIARLLAGNSLPDIYQKAGVTIDNSGGDAIYFYTKGADRCSTLLFYKTGGDGGSLVFAGGNACWLALQQKVANWINSNGGSAVISGSVSLRWDWDSLKGLDGLWHNPSQ